MPTKSELERTIDELRTRLLARDETVRQQAGELASADHVILDEVQREQRRVAESSGAQASVVMGSCARVLREIDERGLDANINSLGELQGCAAMLNAYCGAFAALRHLREGREKKPEGGR